MEHHQHHRRCWNLVGSRDQTGKFSRSNSHNPVISHTYLQCVLRSYFLPQEVLVLSWIISVSFPANASALYFVGLCPFSLKTSIAERISWMLGDSLGDGFEHCARHPCPVLLHVRRPSMSQDRCCSSSSTYLSYLSVNKEYQSTDINDIPARMCPGIRFSSGEGTWLSGRRNPCRDAPRCTVWVDQVVSSAQAWNLNWIYLGLFYFAAVAGVGYSWKRGIVITFRVLCGCLSHFVILMMWTTCEIQRIPWCLSFRYLWNFHNVQYIVANNWSASNDCKQNALRHRR